MYNVVRSFLILTFFAANETKEMETIEIWQQQYIYLLCVTTGFYILKFDHFHYHMFTTFILSFLFE